MADQDRTTAGTDAPCDGMTLEETSPCPHCGAGAADRCPHQQRRDFDRWWIERVSRAWELGERG